MRYDLEQFREEYKKALENSKIKLKALRVFDAVCDSICGSIESLITELTTDPKFLHLCAGKATEMGHRFYAPIGNLKNHPDFVIDRGEFYIKEKVGKGDQQREAFLLRSEEAWDHYKYETTKRQFEISLRGSRIGRSYAFRMYWPDNTHDSRNGCNVEYSLLVPNEEIDDKVPKIVDNPHILISTLRKVFPFADNSNDTLRFREGHEGIKLEKI